MSRRPVLWGGRAGDYQVGGPEDRARSLILNGTAAYRRAAAALIREVAPAMARAFKSAAEVGRILAEAEPTHPPRRPAP